MRDFLSEWWGGVLTALAILGVLLFYVGWLNHVSINEIGIAYDSKDGEVWTQNDPGWYLTNPLVLVTYIPTLPFRVTIPSTARVINAKIVRFNVDGVSDYIRLQGWEYQMRSDMESAFLGYAFSGQHFPFLIIVQEGSDENYGDLRPGPFINTKNNNPPDGG